jgi:hypothetical protein
LIKAISVISKEQKAYGKQIDVDGIYSYMQRKLEKLYSVAQIINAIDVYTDRNDDIPTPSDIINIITPVKKINQSEYIEALKQRDADRKNGCSSQFSWASSIIADYHAQEDAETLENLNLTINGDMQKLISSSIKEM